MSLRIFFGLLLTGVFAVSIGFIALMVAFLRDQLSPVFAALGGSDAALQTFIIQYGIASLVFAAALLVFIFWVLGKQIAAPLKQIVAAMNTFAQTGERVPLPDLRGAPQEIRALLGAFAGFSDRVEESHKHDVEISRVKSDFISTAAHQLRTPLTGIRWALEALEKEQLTEGQQALVQSAKEKSHQLVAVVGTLLDISAIESGKYKYAFERTDLAVLASEVARDFEPLAVKSQVTLFFEKSPNPLPSVSIDRERIRWVLNNLVENGIRYTPPGGSVKITTDSNAERVYLRVRDTGIGIAPEDRGNIFERFYRAPNAIAKENAGNGLGLYIARTIATDHGGDLAFQANEGAVGTTFVLSLPVAR